VTTFDWLFVLVLGYCAVKGFLKGFIRIIADLAALVLSIGLGIGFYKVVAHYIQIALPSPAFLAPLLGFIVLAVTVFGFVTLAGIWLDKLISLTPLKLMDRFLGLGMGTLKGILIGIPLFLPALYTHIAFLENSVFFGFYKAIIKAILWGLSLKGS